jgi:hypothetical protein
MTKYLGAADTAKVVRKILKAEFPGVKFSVRSETYSMGCSVRVHWEDGPTSKQVDQAVGRLSGSGFDGMIDLKYSISHWLSPDGTFSLAKSQGSIGSGGMNEGFDYPKPHPDAIEVTFADHISCTRSFSTAFLEKVKDAVSSKFGGEVPTIQGSAPYQGYHFQDYNQERLYWTILSSSVINKAGKVVCHDHLHGAIINRNKGIYAGVN